MFVKLMLVFLCLWTFASAQWWDNGNGFGNSWLQLLFGGSDDSWFGDWSAGDSDGWDAFGSD